MMKPTETEKKIVAEVLKFVSNMGFKIEKEFPRKASEIARVFVLVGLTRFTAEHGSDGRLTRKRDGAVPF